MATPHTITTLSHNEFHNKIQSARVLLFYPWTTYRTAFLSYLVEAPDFETLYYRINGDEETIRDWLSGMLAEFDALLGGFGSQTAQALEQDDPIQWAGALASDLRNSMAERDQTFLLFIDEADRVPQDRTLRAFIGELVSNLPDGMRLAVSSRLLTYRPWYDFVANGEAVVFGTERREDDGMYTVEEDPKPALEIYALGRGYALVNGRRIANWDGALPRNLFFYLVDNPLVTRDQIFETFWPKLTTKEATNVFHVTKRKISERITIQVEEEYRAKSYELTQYSGGFYMPSTKVIRHYDVRAFQDALDSSLQANSDDEEIDYLNRAIDLYRGPFLQDKEMPWMQERRVELRQKYAQALISMGRLKQRNELLDDALGFYIRALKETPEREDIHREVMMIYEDQNRRQDAISQYQQLERILDTNYQIRPSRESRELYERITS